MNKIIGLFSWLILLAPFGYGTLYAQVSLKVVADFGEQTGAGASPAATFIQAADGNFYGTTSDGDGTVFEMTPDGILSPAVTFTGTNGSAPTSLIQGQDHNFYGTAATGGASNHGLIFEITSMGVLKTLATFTGTNGAHPTSLIQGDDGNFYGTTARGGDAASDGTLFKLTPGGILTTLAVFGGTKGYQPNHLIQGTDGNFYGLASFGATTRFFPNGGSLIFKATPAGALSTLIKFNNYPGVEGSDNVVLSSLVNGRDGNLYVIDADRFVDDQGSNFYDDGISVSLVEISVKGDTVNSTFIDYDDDAVFEAFGENLFTAGTSLVQGTDGNFYCTVSIQDTQGLSSDPENVFQVSSAGHVTDLGHFDGSNGSSPKTLIQSQDGSFYGTTSSGGSDRTSGVVFNVSIQPESQTITFPVVADQSYGTTFTLGATASSRLPVSYTSSGPVRISVGKATIVGVGKVSIRAHQNGNTFYAPAPTVLLSFNAVPASQTITFPAVGTVAVGQKTTLAASSSSGLTVTYSIVPTAGYDGAATISGTVITFTKAGHVKVAADQPGDTDYQPAAQIRQNVIVQ